MRLAKTAGAGARENATRPAPARGGEASMRLRVEIFPADLDATVAFYVGVLRFTLDRDDRATPHPYVSLSRGDALIGAAARPAVVDHAQRRPPTGVELVLTVEDVDADRAHVEQSGWPVAEDLTDRPWELRNFRILDPDGYYLRITSREPVPAAQAEWIPGRLGVETPSTAATPTHTGGASCGSPWQKRAPRPVDWQTRDVLGHLRPLTNAVCASADFGPQPRPRLAGVVTGAAFRQGWGRMPGGPTGTRRA